MSPHGVQDLFRHKNVVVTGCQHPVLQFNEAGLRTLAPLDSQVSIQGKALHVCYYYLPAKALQIILLRHQARIGTPTLLLWAALSVTSSIMHVIQRAKLSMESTFPHVFPRGMIAQGIRRMPLTLLHGTTYEGSRTVAVSPTHIPQHICAGDWQGLPTASHSSISTAMDSQHLYESSLGRRCGASFEKTQTFPSHRSICSWTRTSFLTKSSMNHVLASKLLFYGQAISCKLICA